MYVNYTFQDWQREPEDKRPFLQALIADYKASPDFTHALEAQAYFDGRNTAIASKTMLQMSVAEEQAENGKRTRRAMERRVAGARIPSNFFRMAVMQSAQFLLSNGVTLDDPEDKSRLGLGFDNRLEQIGEKALIDGVCYGFWNMDHIEVIPAAENPLTGAVALLDELSGNPRVVVQFWQINRDKPQYIRTFEHDGVTVYQTTSSGGSSTMAIISPKRAYKLTTLTDAIGTEVIGEENYKFLPVIPMFANNEHVTELTPAIKEKLDAYDRIMSDFSDNLDRANDVYWALNNFGGSLQEALQTAKYINELKLVINQNDGSGSGGTAEPHTVEVPYAARQAALDMLRRQLYDDFMALDMSALSGGSLTNVAIRAAMANLNLRADRFEWHVFAFMQTLLELIGIQTENITFKRQTISNDVETVQAIYLMRSDIDQRTALELNPFISADDIDAIMQQTDAEQTTGMQSMEALRAAMQQQTGTDDGQEPAGDLA